MIVIMDMTSGEWTVYDPPEESVAAVPERPSAAEALPQLALQEVSFETPRRAKLPFGFPPAFALPHLPIRH